MQAGGRCVFRLPLERIASCLCVYAGVRIKSSVSSDAWRRSLLILQIPGKDAYLRPSSHVFVLVCVRSE